jgi:hypothetical protein
VDWVRVLLTETRNLSDRMRIRLVLVNINFARVLKAHEKTRSHCEEAYCEAELSVAGALVVRTAASTVLGLSVLIAEMVSLAGRGCLGLGKNMWLALKCATDLIGCVTVSTRSYAEKKRIRVKEMAKVMWCDTHLVLLWDDGANRPNAGEQGEINKTK